MTKLTLQDLDLRGKKVLMRVDFNVPLNKDGTISDETRLRESLPSIRYILDAGGSVILMSHLGRPKGVDPHLSLSSCATALSELLHQPVLMAKDCIGKEVETMAHSLKPGQVLLLENLRFHAAEEDPALDPSFVKKLAALGDIYINDAFGTAHRSHASTAVIASFFPGKAGAGLLMQKEMRFLGNLLQNPSRPFYAVIGGAKVSTKIKVLKSLLSKTDGIFIGGGMAFTFFKAQGINIGDSLCEDECLGPAREFLNQCASKNIPLWLPIDNVIADAFTNEAHVKVVPSKDGIPPGWQGMDIGEQTIEAWRKGLQSAKTVFWNGPLGVFEFPRFARGTEQIAKLLSSLNANTIIGGGDSVAAVNRLGLTSKFSHVSTGGGASLELIEHGRLPGIDALSTSPI